MQGCQLSHRLCNCGACERVRSAVQIGTGNTQRHSLPRCYPLAEHPITPVCKHLYQYGEDGHKIKDGTEGVWTVCETKRLQQPGCIVYAFGVGYNPSFDIEFAQTHPNCQVHSFDPTTDVLANKTLGKNHFFHPWVCPPTNVLNQGTRCFSLYFVHKAHVV